MATRQMLSRATEGTQAPTPGYLYKDLTVAAQTNPTVCQEMAQYLTQRLQKTNPNIKYKSLKLIAKIADQVPHFKRCLSQSPHGVSEIKAHINYRGALDPVRGDEPNLKIRQAAQEALDAVYREAPTTSSSMAAPNVVMGGGGNMYGANNRRMDGMGNPRYSDPRLDPRYNGTQPTTIGEAVREAGEVVIGMIKDPLARNLDVAPSVGGVLQGSVVPSRGFGELPQYNRPPPGAAELSRQTQGQWTMASNRGPNAVAPPPSTGSGAASPYQRESDYYANQTRASSGAVGGSWGNAAPAPPPVATAGGYGHGHGHGHGGHSTAPSLHVTPHPSAAPPPPPASGVPSTRADGSYERNLILELCPPSGLKAVPPPDKLAHFSKLVPSLNPDLVCPALLDCLEEGQPWIIRAKALCVMETTLYGGAQASGHNPYRDFFHACQEEILPMAGHPRAAISGPAKRVLALLGVDSGVVDTAVSHAHRHQEASLGAAAGAGAGGAAPNLLDFDDDDNNNTGKAGTTSAPAPAAPSSSTANPDTNGGGSLFGGMQVKASAVNGGPRPSTGMAYNPSPEAPSLLDDFVGASAATAVPVASSQDIFRPSEATATATASMFGQMTLKSTQEDKKSDSEDGGDLAAPPANGSAFGFINSADSSAAGAAPGSFAKELSAPASTSAPPPPTAASFDPLKNFSPNSTKKSMTMSPEQMQAMAYQQMMMQQQQIQLQRMMMQQQGMVFTPGVVGAVPVLPVGAVHPGMQPMPGGGQHHMAGLFKAPSASAGAPQAGKDDKKFDFVKDAMQTAGKK